MSDKVFIVLTSRDLTNLYGPFNNHEESIKYIESMFKNSRSPLTEDRKSRLINRGLVELGDYWAAIATPMLPNKNQIKIS